MRVLSRRIGEEIQIGSCVSVTVLAVSKRRVKLGITGPPEIPVVRSEVSEQTPVRAEKALRRLTTRAKSVA
jgi:carbon storage regulator CsrA